MEYLVFFALVVGVGVYVIWQRQRRIKDDLDARRQGLPDDVRDKNTGMGSLPNGGKPWSGGR